MHACNVHVLYMQGVANDLNLGYIHDDIIMDLIVGLNSLEGYAVG